MPQAACLKADALVATWSVGASLPSSFQEIEGLRQSDKPKNKGMLCPLNGLPRRKRRTCACRVFGIPFAERTESLSRFMEVKMYPLETVKKWWQKLTKREKEIALEIVHHPRLRYRDIAAEFDISPNTIKAHMRNVLRKTELDDRFELYLAFAEYLENVDSPTSKAG